MPKESKEGLRAFTGNYGPPQCDGPIHQYSKWAAWRVNYRHGEPEYYCLWCFPRVKSGLSKGTSFKRLRKKRP